MTRFYVEKGKEFGQRDLRKQNEGNRFFLKSNENLKLT